MLTILTLFVLGFAVGTFGTLVGIGGGIFLVPIFILVMHYSPQNAIGTSLAVVFMNALSGTVAYIRPKKVYYDAGFRFSLATIPGAIAGSYLAGYFTSKTFTITFGLMLVVVASLMLYRSYDQTRKEMPFDPRHFTYNRPLGVVLSFFIGFLSSVLGIGGGVIHVPILVYILGFPTHVATATSHFVLAVSSLFGVGSHFSLGNILLGPALAIGLGAMIGAQFGARLSLKLKSRPILILLSLSMAALGIRLALS